MHTNQSVRFYQGQSATTDPRSYRTYFDQLPSDLEGISRVAQGLVYHYFGDEPYYGWKPPEDRIPEINTRTMERILATLLAKDTRPLSEPRSYENRMVGCCRDFSLLACAILRHQGRSARLRYGFASYFTPQPWLMDHVIVEVWEDAPQGGRWRRFDPELPFTGSWVFDTLDMPDQVFITGGRAWEMCRNEGACPEHFGLGPDVPDVCGWWFIRQRLQLDVAALNKRELLCWDELETLDEKDRAHQQTLDEMASLSMRADSAALRERCAYDASWQLPTQVQCFHPLLGSLRVAI